MSLSILQFFEYEHLPPHLQTISRPFGELARQLDAILPLNPEKTHCLRKLLEAKDCAVRAKLYRETVLEVAPVDRITVDGIPVDIQKGEHQWFGTSPTMPGLLVVADTADQVAEKVPQAIADMKMPGDEYSIPD